MLLRKQTQREIAIVCVRSGIRLMHAKGGGLAAFGARAQSVLGDASHRIDHRIAQLQQFFLLLAGKRVQLAIAVVAAEQSRAPARCHLDTRRF